MKASNRYIETFPNELNAIKTFLKKYKCKTIEEIPVNNETLKIIYWFKNLKIEELERFSMDAFNSGLDLVFKSICPMIFEKLDF